MSGTHRGPIGVRFDQSFPKPPSLGALADRLNRSVERVERGATVAFTDDPTAVRDAAVVATTTPRVVAAVENATPVRWSHTDPPWTFLAAAASDASTLADGHDSPRANESSADERSVTDTPPPTDPLPPTGDPQATDGPLVDESSATDGPSASAGDPSATDELSTTPDEPSVTNDPSPTDGPSGVAASDGTPVGPTDPTGTNDGHAARRTPAGPHGPERGRPVDGLTEPAATLRVDPGGRARIEAINDPFAALTDGPVVGEPPETADDGLPDPVADRLRAAAGRARASERGPSRNTVRVARPDGTRHYVAHDAPYADGDTTRSLVVFAEVTALKRRETQTAVLTRILRHNLRNEVTIARGYAERIERDADNEAVRTAARRIRDATATLAALGETAGSVQAVLDDEKNRWTTHDLPALLERVAVRVGDRFPDATVAVDEIEPARVVGTHNLERALVELAENAVCHADCHRPTARLSADRTDDAVRIAVADEGPGIPDAEWAVVADRREITQLHHSSGLGLWLVRWVTENNGGRLERHEDDGTRVVVHLPRDG